MLWPHVLASEKTHQGRQRAPVLEHRRKLSQPRRTCRATPSALSRRNQRQPASRVVPHDRRTANRFQRKADGAVSHGQAPELDCEVVQVKLNEIRLHRPRQWGACGWRSSCGSSWNSTDSGNNVCMSRQGTKWLEVLKTQVCYQLIDPGSEWRLHRHWYEHSAMQDLLASATRVLSDDTLYRCLDKLLAHKRAFFSFLRQRWEVLFQAPLMSSVGSVLAGAQAGGDPAGLSACL